jgi:hypothetical protein
LQADAAEGKLGVGGDGAGDHGAWDADRG